VNRSFVPGNREVNSKSVHGRTLQLVERLSVWPQEFWSVADPSWKWPQWWGFQHFHLGVRSEPWQFE
jgi:hypothetical protein